MSRKRLTPKQLNALIAATADVSVAPKRRQRRRRRRGSMRALNSESMVTVPAAMSVVQRAKTPRITGGYGTMTVSHSELTTTLAIGTASQNPISFRLIPSFPPWLAGVASNFSKFKWLSLKVVYVPSCPSTTPGSIHMGVAYDTNDVAGITTLAQISSLQGYTTGALWSGSAGAECLTSPRASCPPGAIVSVVDVKRLEKPYYSYRPSGGVPAAFDLANTVVPATLVVMVDGTAAANTTIGHLHWVYTIQCLEPVPTASNQ
nr:MAG: putative coat protein P3 [Sobemovirus sp.]